MQENFNLPKWWHTNESSSMPLTRKAWEQDPQEPGSQDPPPGPDPQNLTRGMTQYPASSHVTEKFPIPSIGEGTNDKGHINQVIHITSVQDLTKVNLYAETLASKSVEYHYMPSYSRLIPE